MIEGLPRREREVFEILCGLRSASAASVRQTMTDPLSDSAVRTLLKRLEDRGLVARESAEGGIRYRPVPGAQAVVAGALQRMVDTFFAGSAVGAATALLGMSQRLSDDEIAALEQLIDAAKAPKEQEPDS